MALRYARLPIDYYPDPTQGRPVFNGSVYFGEPGLDPFIEANRKTVILVQENGTQVPILPAAQPLLTGPGGTITYAGSTSVQLLIDGAFSIKVLNSLGAQVYYMEDSLTAFGDASDITYTPATGPVTTVEAALLLLDASTASHELSVDALNIPNVATLRATTGGDAQKASLNGYWDEGDNRIRSFYWDETSTETDNGVDIFKVTAVNPGRWKAGRNGAIHAKDGGVRLDGVTNDDAAWVVVMDYVKATNATVFFDGYSLITSTVEYDTTGMGISPGLRLLGQSEETSGFINENVIGDSAVRVTSGVAGTDFQFAGELSNFSVTENLSGIGSHGVEYQGTWRLRLDSLRFINLNGSGIKATNTASDADSSTFVEMDQITARDCVGPGYDSIGSTGGLALHTLKNYHFENCNGSNGNLVIDGAINFRSFNHTIVGNPVGPRYVATQTGIKIQATNITPQVITIEGGEMGNSLQKGISVDAVSGLTLGSFRIVKRFGENTMTEGVEFADGVSTILGVEIDQIEVALDDATPPTTLFKIGTGLTPNGLTIKAPNINSFASGNTYISFNAGADDLTGLIEDSNGYTLFPRAKKRYRTTEAAGTALNMDMLNGNWHQFLLSDVAIPYTLNPPTSGVADGMEIIIGVWNIAGAGTVTVNFAAGINASGFVNPGPGLYTETVYRYDLSSLVWRASSAWSTPS